jgi:hypothetical protein
MSYTPPLEAEITAFKTTALLGSGVTYQSSVDWNGDVNGYTQVQTEVNASHDGTIRIDFCEDAAFTVVVRTLTIPYVAADGYQFFSAPAFVNFIRYSFTNDAGVTQTEFYYTTKITTTGISPQLLTTGAFIAPAMVATLGRNIIVGQDENGVFGNATVTSTTNSAGTYQNLNVVSGARPSQLPGRTPVLVDINLVSASAVAYTVTALKKLYITDLLLSFENTSTGDPVQGNLEDTLGGAVKVRFIAPEAVNSTTTTTEYSHTFAEPISFSTEVYVFIASGGGIGNGILSGTLIGYEE